MKQLLILAAIFFSFSVHAQGVGESGGHGRHKHPRHQQQQQQQQDLTPHYKTKIIHGDEAKELFFKLIDNKKEVKDLTEKCGKTIREVGDDKFRFETKCFEITIGSDPLEYVCYVKTSERISALRAALFNWTHNQCGLKDLLQR